jgi:putative membrane protein
MHARSILVTAAVFATLVACRRPDGETSSTRTTGADDPSRTTTTTQSQARDVPANQGTTGNTVPGATVGQGATANTGTPQPGAMPLAEGDQKFLKKAVEGSLMEISAARHVTTAGSNPEVKTYANKLLADHTKAHEDLQKLAAQKGFALPAQIAGGHDDMVADLTKLGGAQLDKKYAKEMVDDHEKDVKEFREAAKDVKDADLRAWAQKQIPVLEGHLTEAKALEKKIK